MLGIQLLIAILTLLWAYVVMRTVKTDTKQEGIKDATNSKLYLIPILSLAFFLTVFRGENTSVDYVAYKSINNILFENSWSEIWNISYVDMEPLLLSLMKVLSYLEIGAIPFLFVTTLTVLAIYYKTIRKYSKIAWLSVFLVFCFASYFTIFNTTAQMFASLIALLASTYLYRGKFWRYALVIAFAALFHKTALIMIPLYFLLRLNPGKYKMGRSLVLMGAVIVAGLYFVLDNIVELGAAAFFPEYVGRVEELPVVSPLIAVKPLLILGFVWMCRRYLNFDNMMERVWFNSLIYVTILTVFAIQFGLMQRFTYFLLPYTVLIVPLVISRLPKRQQQLSIAATIIIAIAYIFIANGISTVPYSFIWDAV